MTATDKKNKLLSIIIDKSQYIISIIDNIGMKWLRSTSSHYFAKGMYGEIFIVFIRHLSNNFTLHRGD